MLTYIFLMFRYGMSYFIATSFFGKKIRKDVLKLYSFVRIPDNIVDIVEGGFTIKSDTIYCENKECGLANKNNICRYRCRNMLHNHYKNAYKTLNEYWQDWQLAFDKKDFENQKFGQYVRLFEDYNIPFEYTKSFFDSMLMDCSIFRYNDYKQLNTYMYGSAAVIGLMMCSVMGVKDKRALPYAQLLGDAMQITNFLRDIKEDVIYLDRIYLPSQDLQKYGLNNNDIINFSNDFENRNLKKRSDFQSYMKDKIIFCRQMYQEASIGYKYLNKDTRRAVSLASLLYQEILSKIEKNDYDVFNQSARTNILDKIKVVFKYRFI